MSNLSRRSFVELTVGSIESLPLLAGGLVVAPTTALAADEKPSETESETLNYAIIDVVSP